MLTPTLLHPSDLFNKLLREQHRTFHAQHPVHVADHLYNFCITALALRDYVFESQQLDDATRQEFHARWAAEPALVACREIANTAKHSTLKHEARTRAVVQTTTSAAGIYLRPDGALETRIEARADILVLLSDHSTVDVLQLTTVVISFWRNYFGDHALALAVQSESEFFGVAGAAT